MKNFNGFSTQEEYDYYLDLVKDIQESEDNYDRDTIMVSKDNYSGCIDINIDKYRISVWDSETVEIYSEDNWIDGGIVEIVSDIKFRMWNENFFYEEETEE